MLYLLATATAAGSLQTGRDSVLYGDLRLAPCRRRDEKEALALQSHTQNTHNSHQIRTNKIMKTVGDKALLLQCPGSRMLSRIRLYQKKSKRLGAKNGAMPSIQKPLQPFPLDPSALFASKSQKHPPDLDHILGHAYIQ